MIGSLEAGHGVLVAVLILSSLMNIVYLLTPAVRAFTDPLPGGGAHPDRTAIREAPILCVVPAWCTAIGTVALFFFMDDLGAVPGAAGSRRGPVSDHPEILDSERSVFERPGTIRAIWVTLIVSCLAFAAAGFWLAAGGELVYEPHFDDQEGPAGLIGTAADRFPAFYALVGFASFAFIVLAGQHLRAVLMRPEGYYDGAEAERHNPVATDVVEAADMDVGAGR